MIVLTAAHSGGTTWPEAIIAVAAIAGVGFLFWLVLKD